MEDRKELEEWVLEVETALSRFQILGWIMAGIMIVNLAVQVWRVCG